STARASATSSVSVVAWRGGQSASSACVWSTQSLGFVTLGFVIVAIRRVFVHPPPELPRARAHVRARCDQLREERPAASLVILQRGVGWNEFHGQCLMSFLRDGFALAAGIPSVRCSIWPLCRCSTRQVQTKRVKSDVVARKLRFNCV